jgi:hypothetical protein
MDMIKTQVKIASGVLEDVSRRLVQEWKASQT